MRIKYHQWKFLYRNSKKKVTPIPLSNDTKSHLCDQHFKERTNTAKRNGKHFQSHEHWTVNANTFTHTQTMDSFEIVTISYHSSRELFLKPSCECGCIGFQCLSSFQFRTNLSSISHFIILDIYERHTMFQLLKFWCVPFFVPVHLFKQHKRTHAYTSMCVFSVVLCVCFGYTQQCTRISFHFPDFYRSWMSASKTGSNRYFGKLLILMCRHRRIQTHTLSQKHQKHRNYFEPPQIHLTAIVSIGPLYLPN